MKERFGKEINCEIIAQYFEVFQQFLDNKIGIVIIPFFTVLLDVFMKQLKEDRGTFFGVTDFFEYPLAFRPGLSSNEAIHTFVLHGKIVNIKIDKIGVYKRLIANFGGSLACKMTISVNSETILKEFVEYFYDFLEKQDFIEIKKQADELLKGDNKACNFHDEIKEFYATE